jgi:hypothetical protein
LDDWRRAVNELPPAAARHLEQNGETIANMFFREPALPYVPVLPLPSQ